MDLKALIQTVDQIAEEKSIGADKVIEAIEGALASAYKREYDKRDFNIKATLNRENGDVQFVQVKEVVDKGGVRMVEDGEVEEEEGNEWNFQKNKREIHLGRSAAQTAKQVVLQKLREAERDSIVGEFKDKEGGIVSGVVQRFERGNVFL